jgi:hypothetical protein
MERSALFEKQAFLKKRKIPREAVAAELMTTCDAGYKYR